jgi:hypothetical protein
MQSEFQNNDMGPVDQMPMGMPGVGASITKRNCKFSSSKNLHVVTISF